MFLCILAIFFALLVGLSNVRWFCKQFSTLKLKRIGCSVSSYLHHGFILPLFLSIVASLIRSITSTELFDTEKPNGLIMKKAFKLAIIPMLVGLINIAICVLWDKFILFTPYDTSGEFCVESTFYSAISLIFPLVLIVKVFENLNMCKHKKQHKKIEFNNSHRKRIRVLPSLMIPFIVIAGVCLPQEFITNRKIQIVLKFAELVLSCIAVLVYLHFIIIVPLNEAIETSLMRGDVTKRHGLYKGNLTEVEHAAQNLSDISDELESCSFST